MAIRSEMPRILAGSAKGRGLEVPPGKGTRPPLARIRKSVFDALAPRLPGARVLDLYAGCGSMGLEALSRGAVWAVFVEKGWVPANALRENAERLGFLDRCEILHAHAERAVARLSGSEPFDVVFVDPPFPVVKSERERKGLIRILGDLGDSGLVVPDGVILLRIQKRGAEPLPANLRVADRKAYGDSIVLRLERVR